LIQQSAEDVCSFVPLQLSVIFMITCMCVHCVVPGLLCLILLSAVHFRHISTFYHFCCAVLTIQILSFIGCAVVHCAVVHKSFCFFVSLMSSCLPPTNEGGKCFCLCLSVCLSVCLLARLLKNRCMDLDETLRVDRCRDMDELINFRARSGCRNHIAFSDIV